MNAATATAEITSRSATVMTIADTFRWIGDRWTGRAGYVLVVVRGYGANPQLVLEEARYECATIEEAIALAEREATLYGAS